MKRLFRAKICWDVLHPVLEKTEPDMSGAAIPQLFDDAPLRELNLPFEQRMLSLLMLQDARALHTEIDPGYDVYWGELWPAAVALADAIFAGAIRAPEQAGPVLEVGCGTGLVSVALAMSGAKVIASDREFRALRLAGENARRNGVAERVATQRLDWREPYAGRHALIIAGDCLYQADACWQLAVFLRETLDGPGARAYVVDPDRWSARNFGFQAQEAGLRIRTFRRRIPFVRENGPVREISARTSGAGQSIDATFYELSLGTSNG